MTRIKEPSTWAGLAALLLGLKAFVPLQYAGLIDWAVQGAGALAIVLREGAAAQAQ